MNSKLAIFISCSSPNDSPVFPFLYNVYAGSALNNERPQDMLADNLGENISDKNKFYCELTVQYYAWKNSKADYLGFFHSRRYISFNSKYLVDNAYSKRHLPKAYSVEKFPTEKLLTKHEYDKVHILSLLDTYPVISALPEYMAESTRNRFIRTQKNGLRELELIESKLKADYPELLPAFDEYMNSEYLYFCNMYILRKDIADKYFSILFDVLGYVDDNLSERIERDDGMIAEQFFGVFMTYIKKQGCFNWAELPRIHFSHVGGVSRNFSCNRLGNVIFPPGSFRRNILRKFLKG